MTNIVTALFSCLIIAEFKQTSAIQFNIKTHGNPETIIQIRQARKALVPLRKAIIRAMDCHTCSGTGWTQRRVYLDKHHITYRLVKHICGTCKGGKIHVDDKLHRVLSRYYDKLSQYDPEIQLEIEDIPKIGRKLLNKIMKPNTALDFTKYWQQTAGQYASNRAYVIAVEGIILYRHSKPDWAIVLAGPIGGGGINAGSMALIFHHLTPFPVAHGESFGLPTRYLIVAYTESPESRKKWLNKWKSTLEKEAQRGQKSVILGREIELAELVARIFQVFSDTGQVLTVNDAIPLNRRLRKKLPETDIMTFVGWGKP